MDCFIQLERANSDLNSASQQIQTAFKKASSKSLSMGQDEIVDPVNLLSRIAAVESSISSLQQECNELAQLRPIVAHQTTSLLLKNFKAIQELSILTRGEQNASIHQATKDLATQTQQQHQYWDDQCNTNGIETEQTVQVLSDNNCMSEAIERNPSSTSEILPSSIKIYQNSQGVINVKLEEDDFNSIPESIRGRCKYVNVINVAMFVYKECMGRIEEGYRGKHLLIDRQQITKYCGGFPGLYSVIMNTTLWRDIVSTLQYLNFLTLDKDGLILMNKDFR